MGIRWSLSSWVTVWLLKAVRKVQWTEVVPFLVGFIDRSIFLLTLGRQLNQLSIIDVVFSVGAVVVGRRVNWVIDCRTDVTVCSLSVVCDIFLDEAGQTRLFSQRFFVRMVFYEDCCVFAHRVLGARPRQIFNSPFLLSVYRALCTLLSCAVLAQSLCISEASPHLVYWNRVVPLLTLHHDAAFSRLRWEICLLLWQVGCLSNAVKSLLSLEPACWSCAHLRFAIHLTPRSCSRLSLFALSSLCLLQLHLSRRQLLTVGQFL